MRKRFQTILLAAGLSAALLSGCVYASDTGVTEAAVEMAADEAEKAVSEAVETAATEAEKAQAEAGADAAQAALKEPAAVTGDGLFTTYYGAYEQQIEQVLSSLSAMTDEQISAAGKISESSLASAVMLWTNPTASLHMYWMPSMRMRMRSAQRSR